MRCIFIIIVSLIISSPLFAGITGKIAGRVVDTKTGKPLPGVNVIVLGTHLGAATDENGEYFIIQVPPGDYAIKASMIGYRAVTKQKVHVTVDLTTKVDFDLEPTVIEVPGIIVTAKRPLVVADQTASTRYVTKEEIESIPDVETPTEILRLQPGVVGTHVRGGRTYETLYLVDGIPIRHPIYGAVAAFDLNVLSIKEMEMLTGGFSAEYGQAQSGVVNIVTREGGPKLSGELEYKTDNYPRLASFNTDYGAFSVGGPLTGKVKFFLSGSGELTDTYTKNNKTRGKYRLLGIKFHDRQSNSFSGNSKLTYTLIPGIKLSLSYRRGWSWWSDLNWAWKNLPDSINLNRRTSDQAVLSLTHTVSKTTFYTLHLGRLMSYAHSSIDGMEPPDFYHWRVDTIIKPETTYVESTWVSKQTSWGWDLDDDGFLDTGVQQYWSKDKSWIWTAKFDLTSQINPRHLVKYGLELNYEDVSYCNIQYYSSFYFPDRDSTKVPGPWPQYGLYRWVFEHGHPWIGAAYLQDKIELRGLIVNAGLRLDYFNPGPTVFDSSYIKQWETVTGMEVEHQKHRLIISPRLGISYPITEQTAMYFNYGKFTQVPELQYIYRDPWTGTWCGNPNLKPQKTIHYEFGFSHQFAPDLAAYIKGFNKDMYDYVGMLRVGMPPIWIWVNRGYGRARGIEVELKKRYSHFTSGNFSYTYQNVYGYSSWEFMEYYRGWEWEPVGTRRLNWDQRHTITASFNVIVPKGEKLFGVLPDRWGANLLWRFGSGLPYTPNDDPLKENLGTRPFTSTTDVRLYKEVGLGKLNLRLFANILNLFNNKNVNWVNPWTGQPWKYGDADGRSHRIYTWRRMLYLRNPAMFGSPRQIKLGIRLSF